MENYRCASLNEAKEIMLDILKEVHRICLKYDLKYWLSGGTLLGAIRHKGFIPWDDDIDIDMLREDFEKFKEIAKIELREDYYLDSHELEEMIEYMPLKIRHKNSIYIEKWDKNEIKQKGIFIDIFPYDKFSKNKILQKIEMFPKYLYELKTTRIWDNKSSLKNTVKYLIIKAFKVLPKNYIIKLNKKYFYNSLKKKEFMIGYGYGLTWRKSFDYEDIFPLRRKEFENFNFFIPKNYEKYLKLFYGDYMKIPDENKRLTHALEIKILDNFEEKKN